MEQVTKRVATGCEGLDQMLRGGLLEGSTTLLEGSAGTGKTTLGLQFIMEGVRHGEHGLVVTFEEFPEQYFDCAAELGWDLRGLQEKGQVEILFTTPEDFLSELDEGEGRIFRLLTEKNTRRVLLDSVTHFERMTKDIGGLRHIETGLVSTLKRQDVTSILLKENPNVLGGWSVTNNKIPFIVDTYLLLRYLEVESEIKRCLMILKMRGSDHDKDIREYFIEEGGLKLGNKFQDLAGIFLGTGVQTARSKR